MFSRFFIYAGKFLQLAKKLVLDVLAPPLPLVREIESLSPADFARKIASRPAPDLKGIVAFFPYKDHLVKTAILEVKSYGNRDIARLLGKSARDLVIAELEDLGLFQNFTNPLLVPIPMTKRALRKRGWNQCELVADEMRDTESDQAFDISFLALRKIRETGDQVGLSRRERLENLKGCFAADPHAVRDRNIIVLDDIATTGATLSEARRALRAAGARKVLCIALAH